MWATHLSTKKFLQSSEKLEDNMVDLIAFLKFNRLPEEFYNTVKQELLDMQTKSALTDSIIYILKDIEDPDKSISRQNDCLPFPEALFCRVSTVFGSYIGPQRHIWPRDKVLYDPQYLKYNPSSPPQPKEIVGFRENDKFVYWEEFLKSLPNNRYAKEILGSWGDVNFLGWNALKWLQCYITTHEGHIASNSTLAKQRAITLAWCLDVRGKYWKDLQAYVVTEVD
ncbi:hypothetical protein B0J14DRAFT_654757 [Halenospora varia]|nr:hypothetical protein B0J14DRAFT_654757 [Halenospora varia]